MVDEIVLRVLYISINEILLYILCEINPGVLYESLDKKLFSSALNKRMLQKQNKMSP